MEQMENTQELVLTIGPKIIAGFVIIGLAILLASALRYVLRRTFRKFIWAPRVGMLITATVFYTILVFGVLTGLGTMGINMVPLIAGLGLGGFALGFAFRDALSNLLAGVLIIVYQPFKEGDTISVSGCQGKVTETNLRYTVLDNDSEQFMVPNSLIFSKPLKIFPSGKEEIKK